MEKRKNILIVEDNLVIALDIKKIVEELNCDAGITSSYDETILYIEKSKPDLIIMDILINGDKDGIETSSYIKRIYNIPIIFLTSYLYREFKNRALDLEPEYFLSKPYRKESLLSAILFVFHKVDKDISGNRLSIGEDYYLDKDSFELYKGETPIKLGKKEKKLLYLLYKEKGKSVKSADLEVAIWSKEIPSSSSLRTLVYRLRGKLDNKFIESIPYYGFRLKV